MRRIMLCALAVMALAVTAIAGEKSVKDVRLGLSIKAQNAPYFVAQFDVAKRMAAEKGFTLIAIDAEGNIEKQISDCEDLLSQNIDVLLINAIDPVAIIPATEAATAAGVPVIGFDTMIDEPGEYLIMVLSNNFENGRAVGTYAAQFFSNRPMKAAVISGAKGNIPGRDRRTGFFVGFLEQELLTKGRTELEIQVQGWGDWAQELGLNAMEDIIVAYPDINAIITENDSMALGAMKAIEEAGKTDQIQIFAVCDGQKEAMELIKNNNEGNYMTTGMNDPALIAGTAIDLAIEYATNGKFLRSVPKVFYTDPVAVTRENVDTYYRPDAIF
ncbi:MAG: substrate-binding domain-containing protein [Planctomycetes bacterium]|nr:substrate-binding domain-containing protein [Planctomycetota bacterium]